MPSIKFNLWTKEIEIKGSESFMESNFNRIQDLLVESFGVKETMSSRETEMNQESLSSVTMKTSRTGAETERHRLSKAPRTSPTAKSVFPETAHDFNTKRPPMRKYIRTEGLPGHQRIVVEVVEQRPTEISIASLKEKFGLSESKIGGIIRDAEKLGKIKRMMGGSYSWT